MSNPSPNDAPVPNRIEEARRALDRKWALAKLTGKKPVHKGWTTRPTDSLSTVTGWLKKGHNVGLRTGKVSGVVVVDDDSPDGAAGKALNLPKTVAVITGSGKRHFYFAAPPFKVGNSVKTLADDIDIRGDGGQVVFVGSIHPDTKQPYRWAPGCSPEDVELAPLPSSILDALRPPEKTKPKLRLVDPNGPSMASASRIKAYAEAALANELADVRGSSQGSRNDALNRSAFALGQLVAGGYLDREHVANELQKAAAACGLNEAEANVTIDSGLAAGSESPRDLSELEAPPVDTSTDEADAGGDSRPELIIYGGWLHTITTKAEHILAEQRPPVLYQRGTVLVKLSMIQEPGLGLTIRLRPMIVEVSIPGVVDKLTELIQWKRIDCNGHKIPIDCPERIAKTLLSRSGSWRLPPLIGVIDAPTLRSDGGLLDKEGYDASTGLFLARSSDEFPQLPERPTKQQVEHALATIQGVLKDFPFVAEEDRSVAIAAIMTALIRPALRTAPLIAFRAAKMGSGKSLLADVVALIATGRPAAVMSQGADENEDKKRMLPILGEGEPVAVIDNIERPFGSAALCSILTQPTWRDRVLGKSQTISLPTTQTTWLATGNNIQFVGDITTRTLVCDLDPRVERPEERRFDVNLHHYIPAHRGELLVAGLTLLRAYHVADRPDMKLSVFGRFEEWSNWIRSTIVWLGLADPCQTRHRVEATDPIRTQLTELLKALHDHFGEARFPVSKVIKAMTGNTTLQDAVKPILATTSTGQSHAQCLGLFFQRVDRRPEGGIRLIRCQKSGGVATWRIERV